MENNLIPEATFEFAVEKMSQTIKRLVIIIIILIVALIGTNAAWFWYESQFEDVITQTVEQDADNGTNNFVGGDIYGFSEGNDD